MTRDWDEAEHPRDEAGRFTEAWAASLHGLMFPGNGLMTHDDLDKYRDRTDYTAERLGNSSNPVHLRTYSDGRQLVHKEHELDHQADNEIRASWMGWAVGAPVPAVVSDPEDPEYGTLSEYIDGLTPSWHSSPEMVQWAQGRTGADRLGLFDLLAGAADRHNFNWLVDDDGHVYGIDHADVEFGRENVAIGPFVQLYYYRDRGSANPAVPGRYIQPPLTQAQLRVVEQRLEHLRYQRKMFSPGEWRGIRKMLEQVKQKAMP